jgi:eukaryotic-like serine/threonine-protein kinase
MPLSAGTRLGPYEILAPIGAGGMGEVYRAQATRLDRIVAIKVMPQGVAADAAQRERFEREGRRLQPESSAYLHALRRRQPGRH